MVWQQLSSRLEGAQEGRFEAQLLLQALKLAISSLRTAPPLADGRSGRSMYACLHFRECRHALSCALKLVHFRARVAKYDLLGGCSIHVEQNATF
jgi:hypothetical protein